MEKYFPVTIPWGNNLDFIISLEFVILYYYSVLDNRPAVSAKFTKQFFAVMCALPLIWQVDASFLACLFANGLGGYLFWLPVFLKLLNVAI